MDSYSSLFANSLLNNDLIGFVSGRSGATGLNRKYIHTLTHHKRKKTEYQPLEQKLKGG
jgi:hypothetical protein